MTWEDVLLGLRFNAIGLAAAMLIAATCAFLGVYVVLKRIVFVSVSLAQISSAGIALAFLVGPILAQWAHHSLRGLLPLHHLGVCVEWIAVRPMSISLFVTCLGVLVLARQARGKRVPHDAVIGIGYVVASALSLLFILRSPKGMEDVRELLDGNIIAVGSHDLAAMIVVFGAIAVLHALFAKQFLFVSFDPEVAATRGYRVVRWELLFFATLGLTISVAIQHAGLLSVFGFMVIPAVTGLLAARRLTAVFGIAVTTSVAATLIGFCLALKWDMPTSPPIIGSGALMLTAAAVASRRKA